MRKILILAREFAQGNNACGICLLNIAKEFVRRGDVVTVLSLKSAPQRFPYDLNGIKVIEIGEYWFTSLNTKWKQKPGIFYMLVFRFIYLLRLPFVFLLYPRISRKQEKILLRKSEKIICEDGIGYVLGSFSPCETAYVPILIKKKYPKITVVNYHLDPLLIPDNYSICINRFKYFKGTRFVKKELSVIDMLLAPDSTKGIIEHCKIKYVGFPLFFDNLSVVDSGFCKIENEITIIYIGTLDKSNRNIEFTINLLEKINDRIGEIVKLHIWGTLLDFETQQTVRDSNIVNYHGTIDNKYVPDLLLKSDFILNVSNLNSYNAIPSKIFQSFSTRKPILNIVKHPMDFSVRYFDKYPLALSIPEYDKELDLNDIIEFINLNLGQKATLTKDAFLTCRPSHLCDLIISANEKK